MGRPWYSDPKVWLLAAAELVLFAVVLATNDIAYLTYLLVVVVLSVALGRFEVTLGLAGLAVVLAGLTAFDSDFAPVEVLKRLVVLLGAGLVAAFLARMVGGTQRSLVEQREHFQLLAENASDMVFQGDREAVIQWASPSVRTELGYAPEEMVGMAVAGLLHPDDVSVMWEASRSVNVGERVEYRGRFRRKDGSYVWVEVNARPLLDDRGEVVARVGSARRIDRQMELERELTRRARYDDLTGSLRRDSVIDLLAMLSDEHRRDGREVAVVFGDMDDFKEINDSFGHAAGDQTLVAVADRLRGAIREDDRVARFGGDEFLVVLRGVHGIDDARDVAEKMRSAVAGPLPVAGKVLRPSISMGVALLHAGESVDELIARADRAMYGAKESGRDRVIVVG